ncbi:MAG TPA: DUF5996 family protein, partial [Gemmatimonadales bacterium]|nr:DUF5996 family protein [Gemmatimonadales bacterium]
MPALNLSPDSAHAAWPDLPLAAWEDTAQTLHLWTQIVGKIRLARAPMANHWWQVPLYVTVRGLTTSPIPHGTRTFEIIFDFVDHRLRIETSEGAVRTIPLVPRTVADFYQELIATLGELGLATRIWTRPVEVLTAIPFEQDRLHASYDAEYAHRFWQVLLQATRVLTAFRGRFLGKASPVHFFWGSFDLAVTRFSGRRAPEHPGGVPNCADWVVREAYSHEVSSCGFWPGAAGTDAVFYGYSYPEPPGFGQAPIRPAGAFYSNDLREFVLPYAAVRAAEQPDVAVLDFAQSAYEAGADLANWDRAALERVGPAP